ncbi:hypothetical protein A2U01_0092564, partial [Trifolium medium]|nr:hypothetical protein [Trifolium medium]
MSDLYLKDNSFESSNVKTNVDASGLDTTVVDVEAPGKASETLGLEKPKSGEILGKSILSPSVDDNSDVGALR